jgi:hypothetical protein
MTSFGGTHHYNRGFSPQFCDIKKLEKIWKKSEKLVEFTLLKTIPIEVFLSNMIKYFK